MHNDKYCYILKILCIMFFSKAEYSYNIKGNKFLYGLWTEYN